EEPEQVVVADVEEEVVRAGVVAVLDQLDQREAEELLVELDRLLGVLADQGQVVDTLNGRLRAAGEGPQVLLAQFGPASWDPLKFCAFWLWHGCCLLAPRSSGLGRGRRPAALTLLTIPVSQRVARSRPIAPGCTGLWQPGTKPLAMRSPNN